MSEHDVLRLKICLCGKRAKREISDAEKAKVNQLRPEPIHFENECVPLGVCAKCMISIRTRQKFPIGLWELHGAKGKGSIAVQATSSFVKKTL